MVNQSNQLKLMMARAFGKWVEEYDSKGWDSHLLTFMFNPLSGGQDAIIRQMSREVERVYSTLLTRVIRNPRSPKVQGSLPKLIGFPDLPVFKYTKASNHDVTINDGLHYHAIVLLPPKSRLKECLEQHVERHKAVYLGKIKTVKERGQFRSKRASPKIQRIDVQPTTHTPKTHTEYALKALDKLPYDHLLILPKSQSENSPRIVEEIPHELIWW